MFEDRLARAVSVMMARRRLDWKLNLLLLQMYNASMALLIIFPRHHWSAHGHWGCFVQKLSVITCHIAGISVSKQAYRAGKGLVFLPNDGAILFLSRDAAWAKFEGVSLSNFAGPTRISGQQVGYQYAINANEHSVPQRPLSHPEQCLHVLKQSPHISVARL